MIIPLKFYKKVVKDRNREILPVTSKHSCMLNCNYHKGIENHLLQLSALLSTF